MDRRTRRREKNQTKMPVAARYNTCILRCDGLGILKVERINLSILQGFNKIGIDKLIKTIFENFLKKSKAKVALKKFILTFASLLLRCQAQIWALSDFVVRDVHYENVRMNDAYEIKIIDVGRIERPQTPDDQLILESWQYALEVFYLLVSGAQTPPTTLQEEEALAIRKKQIDGALEINYGVASQKLVGYFFSIIKTLNSQCFRKSSRSWKNFSKTPGDHQKR